MKIAMIGHKRIPSREGGIEIVVEELATRMAAMGNQVDVYNRKGNNTSDQQIKRRIKYPKKYKGIRLIWIPTIDRKNLDAFIYSFLASIRVLFGHYDVIHYHAEGPSAMLIIPHLFRKRTVVTIHGLDWQRAKWGGFARKFLKFGEKVAAKYADEIIVLSKNVQDYFRDTYGRNTRYIPNGVNEPELRETEQIAKMYGLHKDDYILFLARLVPEKGLHYLLEAFKQIKTDKKLVIAGGTSHTNEYVEKIKKMATEDNRVIMTGFVQGQLLEELYSNCYLYVLPSDVEGMPISLLEAMSYGCKCLVSDIEENKEIIKDYAETFRAGKAISLKESIKYILENPTLFNDKYKIQKYILEQFDWNTTTKQTVCLYNKREEFIDDNSFNTNL